MTTKAKTKEPVLNKDLVRFKQGFEGLANIEASADFSYLVIKDLRIIQKELEIFDEVVKPNEEYTKDYQPKVEEMAKKYCKKDVNDKPLPRTAPNGATMYDFDAEEKIKFDNELEKLEKDVKYKKIVEFRKKQIEDYTKLMEKESLVKLLMIPRKYLPKIIQPRQVEMIFELIEE